MMVRHGASGLPDCVIVGGGPAGLTAAIYLARFHLKPIVVDAGQGRAALIPRTHNLPGYPDGIPGRDLLENLRTQAEKYGVDMQGGLVTGLVKNDRGIVAELDNARIEARSVLIATGVIDRRPAMPPGIHDSAVKRGLIRYCPICDGYEMTDRRIAILGTGEHGVREAKFLRSYSRDITLVSPGPSHQLSRQQRSSLEQVSIQLLDGPMVTFELEDEAITVGLPAGSFSFSTIYPALGADSQSRLAASLGADLTDEGCVIIDSHQRTTVPGLYAAGDVVVGLDQISRAMGQGAVAATAIRNDLCEKDMLLR